MRMDMVFDLRAIALDTSDDSWPGEIDHLRTILGAPHNPSLLPAHFLKVTLARIGGRALQFELDGSIVGVGFLFPAPWMTELRCSPFAFIALFLICSSIRKH